MNGTLDPLPVLDVLYRIDLDEPTWLRALLEAIRPLLVDSPGMAACTYERGHDDRPSIDAFVASGAFRVAEIGRALAPTSASTEAAFSRFGSARLFVLNGMAAEGVGIWIAAILPETLQPALCERWQALALHLARAIGLRRRLHAKPSSEKLTGREREVLAFAAAGNTTKLIAFELGIADATVRVLLKRAAKKLGARNRSDAIARFAEG